MLTGRFEGRVFEGKKKDICTFRKYCNINAKSIYL